MKTDYAYEMYRALLDATLTYVDFSAEMSSRLKQIAEDRHCGDGYFSMDGIHDDLTDLFNGPLAIDIFHLATSN
jgi:hypothetical protein